MTLGEEAYLSIKFLASSIYYTSLQGPPPLTLFLIFEDLAGQTQLVYAYKAILLTWKGT